MMHAPTTEELIVERLKSGLSAALHEAANEIIRNEKQRILDQLHEALAKISITTLSKVRFALYGHEIHIIVNTKDVNMEE